MDRGPPENGPRSLGLPGLVAGQLMQARPGTADRCALASRLPSIISLMDLDDVTFGVVEEDLVPATHRPLAVIGIGHAFFLKSLLEGFDVIRAERDMAALKRIEGLVGTKGDAEIL